MLQGIPCTLVNQWFFSLLQQIISSTNMLYRHAKMQRLLQNTVGQSNAYASSYSVPQGSCKSCKRCFNICNLFCYFTLQILGRYHPKWLGYSPNLTIPRWIPKWWWFLPTCRQVFYEGITRTDANPVYRDGTALSFILGTIGTYVAQRGTQITRGRMVATHTLCCTREILDWELRHDHDIHAQLVDLLDNTMPYALLDMSRLSPDACHKNEYFETMLKRKLPLKLWPGSGELFCLCGRKMDRFGDHVLKCTRHYKTTMSNKIRALQTRCV